MLHLLGRDNSRVADTGEAIRNVNDVLAEGASRAPVPEEQAGLTIAAMLMEYFRNKSFEPRHIKHRSNYKICKKFVLEHALDSEDKSKINRPMPPPPGANYDQWLKEMNALADKMQKKCMDVLKDLEPKPTTGSSTRGGKKRKLPQKEPFVMPVAKRISALKITPK